MGYLKCTECGDKYKLKEGESPEDFDICHCGGQLEYHLSVHELNKRNVDTANQADEEEIAKKKSHDKKLLRIILIIGAIIIIGFPVALTTLLIYRAYFQYPMP